MAKNSGRRPSSKAASRASAQKPLWRRVLRLALIWGAGLAMLGVVFLGTAVLFTMRELPDYTALKSSQNGQMIVVRANDGSELVSLGPSYGKWLSYDEIPQAMKDAIVSTEDRRFRDHIGVDPIALLRIVKVRIEKGHFREGASTITQQLARNIFLNNARTFGRKGREMILALAMERKFTKDQILELYLNKVYFGGGAYGIDAASRKFFGHPATQLSVGEAAIIAGLVKAPSHYSPTADAQASIDRGKVVLQLMAQTGAISQSEADDTDLSQIKMAKESGQNSVRYFTDWALPQLDMLLPETTEPIEVWTTLDPKLQAAATKAVDSNVPKGAQGALVSMDNDGAVLAMVGGTDYITSNYNRATSAVRQPGSSWKLFVYMAALEAGYTPDDQVVDEPITIDGWSPQNDDFKFAGPIDVRSAFAYSKNTIAAKLGSEVGFSSVASMARRFGISTPIGTNPSMVLGTSEVRVIDMTRAFTEVSAGGTSVEPFGIRKVTTTSGRVLYEHKSVQGRALIPPYVAAGITDLLQTAVATGTGRRAQIGRPVAGKTGTTSSHKDGWFLGFSSGVTTGVWMGRDDAKRVSGLWGGTGPAKAFHDYMTVAVQNRPVQKFDTELKLPEWQLEPDDEYMQGNPEDYSYIDENGNVVYPDAAPGGSANADEPRYEDGTTIPVPGSGTAPSSQSTAAANEDFLERATGRPASASPQVNVVRPQQGQPRTSLPRVIPLPRPTPTRTPSPRTSPTAQPTY
ncbi:PBP1A family penicillin-binding protein [Novosphingobium sp. 1949]|uniref:peptidoglycan glycosyltransferase n=1 Tax=Novosphingobium organovorum TaxID=2930092 RepID=A0ABT0BEL4_9SPHN|nr:PBP1A family penicillin-binding protein [Novosphingobium organovorum]MCJ2183508.1 PBP1A family penicillin-binding protein [Novosphingobium organovorum]